MTRFNNFNKTKKNITPAFKECNDVTYRRLHNWYESNFEKLGWMILAKKRGYTDKIVEYKNSLKRLKCSIEKKIKNMHDADKKADLKIILENLDILIEHVEKDFA